MPESADVLASSGGVRLRSSWLRWLVGGLASFSLVAGSASLGWLLNHERRVTRIEDSSAQGGSEADKRLQAEIDRLRQETRDDLKEIKQDIKKLLEKR